MTNLYLFFEFIKISLFSFGGGYGTLPFIYYLGQEYNWYSTKEIMQMVAIAAVTPGAFGVNMATYTGFKSTGILGAILATLGLVIPSYFLSVGIYKIIKKYKDTNFMVDFLETLRAVASGLMFVVVLKMINQEILRISIFQKSMDFNFHGLLFLIFCVLLYFILKKNILYMMISSLIFGVVFIKIFGFIV